MNSQEVTQLVSQEVLQLKNSLVEELSRQLQDVKMGRDAQEPIQLDRESNASDTDMDGPDWSSYLMGAKQIPASYADQTLSDLMGRPPALTLIYQTKAKLPLYEGVPSTPMAKQQQFKDKQLAAVQQKLESTMHLMVNAVEHPEKQHEYLHTAAAFVRSAFEDIHQQRRSAIAGARRHKLEVRPDDDSARMFKKKISY